MPMYFSSQMNLKIPSSVWYTDFSNAINYALTKYMETMTINCVGVVSNVHGSWPFASIGKCVSRPTITPMELMAVCTGEVSVPNIFQLIGYKLGLPTVITGAPTIAGTTSVKFITEHFYGIGQKCALALKAISTDSYTKTTFNDTFDKYLTMAISTTVLATNVLVGAAPGGIFSGMANCKLIG